MSPRPVRIALFSTLAVLGFAACLLAQFESEAQPSTADETPIEKPALPSDSIPEDAPREAGDQAKAATRHVPRVTPRTVYVTELRPLTKSEEEELNTYEKLVKSLREAQDDAARQLIAEQIKELLRVKFDRDMAEREKEIKVVEERVAALRKQHDKRASMKDEIISLNIKTLLFNAEGLDLNFPTAPLMFHNPVSSYSNDPYKGNPNSFTRTPMSAPQPGEGPADALDPNELPNMIRPQTGKPSSNKPALPAEDSDEIVPPAKKAPAKEAPPTTNPNNT